MDLSFLDSVGTVRETLSAQSGSKMQTYLFRWVQDVTERLRQSALEKANATGGLAQSAQAGVTEQDAKVVATISMDDYYDYVNKGVNGIERAVGSPYSFRTPYANTNMVSAIVGDSGMSWIGAKGIFADDGNYNSLGWAIATSLKRKGIEPTRFFDDVINEGLFKEFAEQFERDFAKPIEILISEPLKKNRK